MNGAESLVRTLVNGGVNVCFSNPGTSEMHFVAALDRVGIRLRGNRAVRLAECVGQLGEVPGASVANATFEQNGIRQLGARNIHAHQSG